MFEQPSDRIGFEHSSIIFAVAHFVNVNEQNAGIDALHVLRVRRAKPRPRVRLPILVEQVVVDWAELGGDANEGSLGEVGKL